MSFILSIDQGTTGTTAMLTRMNDLSVIAKENTEFPQIFPSPGRVEHNLDDIWSSVKTSVQKVLETTSINATEIALIGITNQRETTCAFNKNGETLANAIVWQDRRTSDYCQSKLQAYKPYHLKTGLPLDPYFSATKMRWLLNNNEKVMQAQKEGQLLLGTIDTFLLYRLSNGLSYKTDTTNASRTLLMDLETSQWSEELKEFFELQDVKLPQICNSFDHLGLTKNLDFLPDDIPVHCILGDQQAALFGQAGHQKGSLKCTYGTGAFILLNTGDKIVHSSNGLLTTVAFSYQNKTYYALEGATYIAGAAVQWLRDNMGMLSSASEVETLAKEVTNLDQMKNLLFLPFFTGLGSPYWVSEAKAALVGLTRDTTINNIARACLDGIALSVNDSIQAMLQDAPTPPLDIKVDGGACANNLLMQIQANVSGKNIIRPKVIETTAYGVALGAALGAQKISFEEIDKVWQEDQVFETKQDNYVSSKKKQWNEMIQKLYL